MCGVLCVGCGCSLVGCALVAVVVFAAAAVIIVVVVVVVVLLLCYYYWFSFLEIVVGVSEIWLFDWF